LGGVKTEIIVVQKYRKVGDIDERSFIRKKETEVAATKLATSGGATPPSMTKCQVGTPIRSNKYVSGLPIYIMGAKKCYPETSRRRIKDWYMVIFGIINEIVA
jgi:hypothetical protein